MSTFLSQVKGNQKITCEIYKGGNAEKKTDSLSK